jgi:hypothetical protein
MTAYVYLRDLAEDKQTDGFLGKGTEELKRVAAIWFSTKEVVVGEYYDKPRLEVNTKMTTKTIDLEPTWKSIYNAVRHGNLPPEELHKAVVVADVVRQAQKRGETITFHPDGTTTTSTRMK